MMSNLELHIEHSGPTRADALKNRAHILAMAHALFNAQGVESVSMAAIAEAAEVGKGTLYRHFKSKAALVQGLLDDDQRDLQTRTFAHLRTSNDPRASLKWFLGEVLQLIERNRSVLSRLIGFELLDHPAHWWWRQTIRGLLARMGAGSDLDYTADLIYVMVDVQTVLYQRIGRGYTLERIATGLEDTVDRLTRSP